jgi:DDE_Tnp_1-associated/Transposase DDE domain
VQNHFLPNLIEELKLVEDPRNKSYIEYTIEEIIYTMIIKNVCSISSMQEMTEQFNADECVKNMCKILGKNEKEFLPHYVTINECLEKLDHEELNKLRKKMIYTLLRKRSFEESRFLGKYWLVIIDATQLFYFNKKHCKHCLKKTMNKGTAEEKTYYYHNVLEAKIVLGENLVVSIGTEFIENEKEDVKKQDCERKAFKRLAKQLKKMFPRLPICILGDSLYACEPVFQICKDNKWQYIIRYKDGSIPTLAEEYCSIAALGESEEKIELDEIKFKRKPRENIRNEMRWVSSIEYKGHMLTVIELKIKINAKETGTFQWITNLKVSDRNVLEFAATGRKRWKIENQGFNMQKNYRYDIKHANSLNYNAMKNHYLLVQISDILMQLYENGIKKLKNIKRTIKNISSDILNSLAKSRLTVEDIQYIKKRTNLSVT